MARESDIKERTLWCGNISENVTEAILYELFLQGGPLEKVQIPKDKDGKPRRYAFIVYKHACSAPYAAALFQGTALYRRRLNLQYNQPGDEDSAQSSRVAIHQRALSCPVNLSGPLNMSPLNYRAGLMGLSPDINGNPSMLSAYQNQLNIPNHLAPGENIDSLSKSSLMGTWNRNHPYSSSPRMDRYQDRHRSGYDRMEPNSQRRYHRGEHDSHKRSDQSGRKYHHRRK
ncbi:RNA-binding protein 7 [Ischnura elegans]|uniref:RNA-binding protein 7 n=1 Tax=Ischnura elegans TaxID=197161 RepID=UPI001ED8B8B8|nr:RNA-binding protein 7 [Ischnura elegans]